MPNFEDLKRELEGNKTFSSIDADTIISVAKAEGGSINEKAVKNNQIRKFYDVVKNIERKTFTMKDEDNLPEDLIAQLLFLKPHLANAARKKIGRAHV